MNKKKQSSRWKSRGFKHTGNRRRFNGRGGRNFKRKKPQLDIRAFIEKARMAQNQPQEQVDLTVNRYFDDFDFQPQLQKNIQRLGFTQPTPIQDRVFDLVAQGQDVVGIANTGTGKTGAFLIPLLDRLIQDENEKILVIAPTRELATQINQAFMALAKGTGRYSVECIGGVNIRRQINNLTRRHHAIIGTPGRILDLAEQGVLDLSQFKALVLDEVDRMLDMGFVHDIQKIRSGTTQINQSLYFSATMTKRVSQLIQQFSDEVVTVSVKVNETAALVEQEVVKYQYEDKKIEVLHDLLIQTEVEKTVIFGRTKRGVKRLMFELRDRGFRTDSIHGNKTQAQRQRALGDFRKNRVDILVATDVAARGLDIDDVTHVINYEIPETYDDYVHRIGRTGRAGRKGVAYTFVR